MRTNSLSPGFNLGFMDLSNARYSRRINFFSCSSLRLYFGSAATVSIPYEFTEIEEFLILIPNLLHLRPQQWKPSDKTSVDREKLIADVAKLVDALDLGSSAARHGGSSPSIRTNPPKGGFFLLLRFIIPKYSFLLL